MKSRCKVLMVRKGVAKFSNLMMSLEDEGKVREREARAARLGPDVLGF